MSSTPPEPNADKGEMQFAIQKIYVRDFSFESPNAPAIFRHEWRPQVELNLHSDAKRVAADTYEVVLRVTATVKLADETAFLIEVQQAGIFRIVGLSEEQARAAGHVIKVFESRFRPMQLSLTECQERTLMKLVVDAESDLVLGCHMVGPESGEIIQGLAVALKAGATKQIFDETLGIHPTAAEEFVTMRTPLST